MWPFTRPVPPTPSHLAPGTGLSVRTREGWKPATIVATRDEGRQFDYQLDTVERRVREAVNPWLVDYFFHRNERARVERAELGEDGLFRDVTTGLAVEPGGRRYEEMSPPSKSVEDAEAETRLLEGRLAKRSWANISSMEIPSRLKQAAVLVDVLEKRVRDAEQEAIACRALIRRLKGAMLDFRRD